jgi:hypothetical protein
MAFTNTGTINGSGLFNSDLINNGLIDVSGGLREINGTLSSTLTGGGTINIESTGTLQLDKAVSGNTLNFKAATGTLTILNLGSVANTFDIASISSTDVINLPNAPAGFGLNYNTNTGTLAITNGGSTVGQLVFTPTASLTTNFFKNVVLQCFASGTRIATPDGDRPVEALKAGDRVLIQNGEAAEIEWVGHRDLDCERHPAPDKVRPFRIAAHAFGRGMPNRQLLLSPDHAVFVDGVLVPVKCLDNGTTIQQMPVRKVTYYHIELRDHAIVKAEGLTVETLLPGGDKSVFAGSSVTAMYPDLSVRNWEAFGVAPLVVFGPELDAIRQRLDHRAATVGPWRLRESRAAAG